MQKILVPALVIFTLFGCASRQPVADQTASSSAASSEESSSSEALAEEESSSLSAMPVTYVKAVCGSEIPSTWHVRSAADQAIWNTEGNIEQPKVLMADYVYAQMKDWENPPYKPAVFSMAASDTSLHGHAEDPAAEDANRKEVDVLKMSASELKKLMTLFDTALPSSYSRDTAKVGGKEVTVLVNSYEGGKYFGQRLYLIPASASGGKAGLLIYYRANDWEFNDEFRAGFEHFLEKMQFGKCPAEWFGN